MQITPGNLHAPAYNPFHVTSARNSCIWPHPCVHHMTFVQLSLIYGIEMIEHLFRVLPKAQLFQSTKDP